MSQAAGQLFGCLFLFVGPSVFILGVAALFDEAMGFGFPKALGYAAAGLVMVIAGYRWYRKGRETGRLFKRSDGPRSAPGTGRSPSRQVHR